MSLGLRWTRHATDEAANDGLLAEEVEEAPAVEARIIEANPQDARARRPWSSRTYLTGPPCTP